MCRTNGSKQRAGLTLIEILLVAAMLTVVAIAIYSTFNSGLKIWQRLTKTVPTEELNTFFVRIANDLRNSFAFAGIKFVGKKNSLNFATLVATAPGEQVRAFSVGEVSYYFVDQTASLNREQADYSEVYQNKTSFSRPLVGKVQSLSFAYYDYDPAQERYIWKDTWEEEEAQEAERKLPLAVRIRIEINEDGQHQEVTRTITLPAGG